jgi:hypothetical protein
VGFIHSLKPEFPNGPPVAFYRQAHANPRIVTVVALSREEGGRVGGREGEGWGGVGREGGERWEQEGRETGRERSGD